VYAFKIDVATVNSIPEYLTPLQYVIPKWTLDHKLIRSLKSYEDSDELQHQLTDTYMDNVIKSYVDVVKSTGIAPVSIWFTNSVETAKKYEEKLQKLGINAYAYHGKINAKIRQKMIDSFKNQTPFIPSIQKSLFDDSEDDFKPIEALISVATLTIGFDAPRANIGVMTYTTASISKKYQVDARFIRQFEGKNLSYMIDCGRNIEKFGTIYDEFEPQDDIKSLREELDRISFKHLSIYDEDYIFINREKHNEKIQELLNTKGSYSKMTLQQLKKLFEVEYRVNKIIGIGMAFMYKVHAREGYIDKFGRKTHGYTYEKFNKETNKLEPKNVVGFYNQRTLAWILEPWEELLDKYKDDKKFIDNAIKSLKTRLRNIVNNKKNIYSIRFFAGHLEKSRVRDGYCYVNHSEKIGEVWSELVQVDGWEEVDINEYYDLQEEGYKLSFDISEQAIQKTSDVGYEIVIDEQDLPF